MGSRLGGFPLSAFASELLPRVQHNLGDPGAFGRLAQEIVVAALKRLYPGLHDNRGAGTPDCQYNDGEVAWAWEIKYTNGEAVHLGSRDIDGLQLGSIQGLCAHGWGSLDVLHGFGSSLFSAFIQRGQALALPARSARRTPGSTDPTRTSPSAPN